MRHTIVALLLALGTLLATPPARAAAPAGSVRAGVADSARADSAVAATAPEPAVRPVPRDYLAEARAGFTPENRAYTRTRLTLRILTPLYTALVLLGLLFTGLSARFREVAEGLGRRVYVRVLVYFALYSLAIFVLDLPRAWYSGFAIEHQYGLATQSFADWLTDLFKALVFSVVSLGVVPLLALAWAAVEKWPRGWWWRLAAVAVPVAMVATLLQPIVFEPLFNTFTPLRDASLRTQILALGAKAGVPARHVYEVDMSKRTRKLNAYVSGFGASQRIVLWDTTLKTLAPDEILAVMGHEMGHYVMGHVWWFLGPLAVGAFVVFFATAALARAMLAAGGRAWGVRDAGDLAAFPAYVLALGIVLAVIEPAGNALSRKLEHEADAFSLEVTHDNDASARAFLKLARDNKSDPEPPAWVNLLFFDHPPLGERIRFALEYRPWEKGEPNRFYRPGR